jgi:lipopolysaccharide/colanic/teichoic acid biosynthesis glycosyltransferase
LAVWVRFYSGLFHVADLPVRSAYFFYLATSLAVWTALAICVVPLRRPILDSSARLRAHVQIDIAAFALVSALMFFWRSYSFSRITVAVFWALHLVFCAFIDRVLVMRFRTGTSEAAGRLQKDSVGPTDYEVSKRILDVVAAAVAAILLAPVGLVLAVVILVRSGRPVLIAQERVGRGERRFRLLKFRTLPVSALATSDHAWSVEATDRLGLFLRTTGLDELPQLLNVLRGDMSLVGPRPERPHFAERFKSELPDYAMRHRLQVGITGWAQVNGWRGDTSIRERVECDLYYLRHWSLRLDLRILGMTAADFLRRVATAFRTVRTDAGAT